MGYFGGDWERSDYDREVRRAKMEGREKMTLDTEHCSWHSNKDLKAWAEADGYTVMVRMDSVLIDFGKGGA